ncbi:MAG: transposase-like protein [bacterium]|nr:MAG: transposase-like protein [bacterium]
MTMKNKYVKRSRISEAKFRELIRHFSLDIPSQNIAILINLNRNTVNRYILEIRKRIAEFCEQESPFHGEIEVDESYFGAKRIKGKRGRGAGSKTPVFGILQRQGKVYTEIIPDCAKSTFYLHLKECEFRFNYRNINIYVILLKVFRKYPLF